MNIALHLGLLVVGFILLIQSAKIFVNGSVGLAQRFGVSTLIIGLTVVAFGTSAPEIVITTMAAIGGSADIAIANIVGSNLFNLIFIVGFCSIISPLVVDIRVILKDYLISLGGIIVLLVMVLAFDQTIPRLASFGLLIIFAAYMGQLTYKAVQTKTPHEKETTPPMPLYKSLGLILIGMAVLIASGHLTVSSAVNIAEILGISQRIIGLTIIAMGTSLPELVTGIIACKKGEGEFILGFVIGSSIFNTFLVLGLAGTITPLAIGPGIATDIIALLLGCIIFLIFAKTKGKIARWEGLCMALLFLAYMTWAVVF